MRKLIGYLSVSVSEYSDGQNRAMLTRLDPDGKHFLPEVVSEVEQPARDPFTLDELLMMAALEVYARRMNERAALNW